MKEITTSLLCTTVNLIAYGCWFPAITGTLILYFFSYEIAYSEVVQNFGYVVLNCGFTVLLLRHLYRTFRSTDEATVVAHERTHRALRMVSESITNEDATQTQTTGAGSRRQRALARKERKQNQRKGDKVLALTHPIVQVYTRILYGGWCVLFLCCTILCGIPAITYITDHVHQHQATSTSNTTHPHDEEYITNRPSYTAQLVTISLQIVTLLLSTCWYQSWFLHTLVPLLCTTAATTVEESSSSFAVWFSLEHEIVHWNHLFPSHPLATTRSWGYTTSTTNTTNTDTTTSSSNHDGNTVLMNDDDHASINTTADDDDEEEEDGGLGP